MRRRRCCAIAAMLALSSALLTGCWDQREIEERTSVVAIGIDLEREEPRLLRVSVQIPIPIKIAGSGGGAGGGGDPVKIKSATGRTTIEAFSALQTELNQKLFYGHTRIIAIGEEMARSGLDDVMDAFRRDPQIRRLLWPLVVKGKAIDLLHAKPELEQIPTVFIMSMIENGASAGTIPDMNLGKFYISLSSTAEQPYLNYMEAFDTVKWDGIALFKEDRMISSLNEEQTWNFLRIRERADGGAIVFPYGDGHDQMVSFTVESISVEEAYGEENGRVKASYTVVVEGDLVGKTFRTDFSNQSEIRKLERTAEEYLETKGKELVETLQRIDADTLGVGIKLKAYHPNIWEEVDDTEYFKNADIRIHYDVNLRRTGMEME